MKSVLKGRDHFYIMHLNYANEGECTMYYREHLWKFAKENEMIGLNHPLVEGSWRDEGVRIKAINGGLPIIWRYQFDEFYNEMEEDDIVMILAGWDSILGIAKVGKTRFRYQPGLSNEFFPHVRKVCWINKYSFDKRRMIPPVKGFVNTLHRVEQGTERWTNLIKLKFP